MKSSRSIDAVTTAPPASRIAATPAHTSIHCIMTPPNMTPATPLVCIGITICVITQRVCSGVTGSRPRSGSSLGRPLGVRLAPPDPARSSLLLLRWRGRLLGRLGGLDPALDALLQLNLTLLAPHLPGSTIVSASHRAWLI